MLITDVRAHHIRIPYDAGVASFKQGASAISALDIVLVEVSTDAGLTGWGDAFGYVCPRTTVDRHRRDDRAAGARPRSAGCRRHSRFHGSHPAQPASVRPLRHHDVRDLRPRHRPVGSRGQARRASRCIACSARASARAFRPMRACFASAIPLSSRRNARPRLRLGYPAIKLHETTVPPVAARAGDRRGHAAHGRHELPDG